ncbi:MAG: V-type ATP synthase subunit F [Acutalibacteraceae bacterium]
MRLYLICDNPDTAVGMRLAGVEGEIVSGKESASKALGNALGDSGIAVILMNRTLCEECSDIIRDFRKAHSTPLIVEIPDRGSSQSGDSLTKYIRETVGINI